MNSPDLLHLAQTYETQMVSFLQALIQHRSVNGQDTEKAVAERTVEEAVALGFSAELVAKDQDLSLIHI